MASPPTRSRDELARARLAGPDEGISAEELSLAARNHAMPMEAMPKEAMPKDGVPPAPPAPPKN